MSGQDWTTTEALIEVRDLARIPDGDPDATDAKLLAEMTRCMEAIFIPMVRKARADYYLGSFDYEFTAGQEAYRIPYRATSATLREAVWIQTSGIEVPLNPVPMTDRHNYKPMQGFPCVYGVDDDSIIVMPTPGADYGKLRIRYERRPSKLVPAATSAAQITAVVASGGNYTVTVPTPDIFTTGSVVDIIDGKAPFSLKAYEVTVTHASGPVTLTYTPAATDRAPAVGDWVCFATETCIPQIPAELHQALYLATAARYLRPIDPGLASFLAADLAEVLEAQKGLLEPRQQGKQMKLKSENSMMRRSGRRRGFFGDWRP